MVKKNNLPQGPKKKYEFKFRLNLRNTLLWLFVLVVFSSFLFSFPMQSGEKEEEIALSQVLVDIKENKIKEIELEDNKINLIYEDETKKFSRKEAEISFAEVLSSEDIDPSSVNVSVKDTSLSRVWINI